MSQQIIDFLNSPRTMAWANNIWFLCWGFFIAMGLVAFATNDYTFFKHDNPILTFDDEGLLMKSDGKFYKAPKEVCASVYRNISQTHDSIIACNNLTNQIINNMTKPGWMNPYLQGDVKMPELRTDGTTGEKHRFPLENLNYSK